MSQTRPGNDVPAQTPPLDERIGRSMTEGDVPAGADRPEQDTTETIGAQPGGDTGSRSDTGAGDGQRLQRDPDEWATGDEPMTAAQRSYLDTLAKESGETLPADLTKAEASKHIDRLHQGSPRLDDTAADQ